MDKRLTTQRSRLAQWWWLWLAGLAALQVGDAITTFLPFWLRPVGVVEAMPAAGLVLGVGGPVSFLIFKLLGTAVLLGLLWLYRRRSPLMVVWFTALYDLVLAVVVARNTVDLYLLLR